MRKVWAERLSILLSPFFLSQVSRTCWQCIGVYVRACVCQQTLPYLHAVVMGAFSVEVAAVVVDAAVVQGAEAHEAVLQGVVALLVHVVVPDHVLLAGEPLETSEKVAAGQGGAAAAAAVAVTESARRHDHRASLKPQQWRRRPLWLLIYAASTSKSKSCSLPLLKFGLPPKKSLFFLLFQLRQIN